MKTARRTESMTPSVPASGLRKEDMEGRRGLLKYGEVKKAEHSTYLGNVSPSSLPSFFFIRLAKPTLVLFLAVDCPPGHDLRQARHDHQAAIRHRRQHPLVSLDLPHRRTQPRSDLLPHPYLFLRRIHAPSAPPRRRDRRRRRILHHRERQAESQRRRYARSFETYGGRVT